MQTDVVTGNADQGDVNAALKRLGGRVFIAARGRATFRNVARREGGVYRFLAQLPILAGSVRMAPVAATGRWVRPAGGMLRSLP